MVLFSINMWFILLQMFAYEYVSVLHSEFDFVTLSVCVCLCGMQTCYQSLDLVTEVKCQAQEWSVNHLCT